MQDDKKYNHKQRKMFGIITAVFFALSAIFLAAGFITDSFFSGDSIPAGTIVVVLLGSVFCVPVFFVSLVGFANQVFNIRRIEKHQDGETNAYSKDSVVAFAVSMLVFLLSVFGDARYFFKWLLEYREESAKALIVPLCMVSLAIFVRGLLFFRERNTEKYIDYVDVRDGRKVRINILSACFRIAIWGLISAAVIAQADTMTKYIFKSRHGGYEKTIEDFKERATIDVFSESLKDGAWDAAIADIDGGGDNLSPQLSFDEVEGAEYYYIYMVDESANSWVHWRAKVKSTQLALGANKSEHKDDPDFSYRGPYPPKGSGEHVYTIYIYAMKNEPDAKLEAGIGFDEPWLAGDNVYYDILNVSDASCNPYKYGNVLAYGFISGTYER